MQPVRLKIAANGVKGYSNHAFAVHIPNQTLAFKSNRIEGKENLTITHDTVKKITNRMLNTDTGHSQKLDAWLNWHQLNSSQSFLFPFCATLSLSPMCSTLGCVAGDAPIAILAQVSCTQAINGHMGCKAVSSRHG